MRWTGTELAGRYRLERELGRGGMGQVWQAEDLHLHRLVAVKLLRAELLGDGTQQRRMLGRFEREGQATARLSHPNITAVYDVGSHLDTPYLVFELLRGRDLKTVVKDGFPGGMPLGQVVEYGAQVAGALAAAHAAGLVHRDIKPANLMLVHDGTVKVCDFGIARFQQSVDPQLTQTGMVIGTPAYMPPEQFQGGPVDAAADMYALGATLFHLATGSPPFTSRSHDGLRHMHVAVPAPRVGSVRAEVSFALEVLVDALLAKEPRRRPTAAETAVQLREPALAVRRPVGHGRDLEAALQAARRIEEAGRRALTLAAIAGTLTEGDASTARTVLTEAERELAGGARRRSREIAAVARVWAPLDPEHAAGLLDETERRARDAAAGDEKFGRNMLDHALADLASAWSVLNPDTAEALTRDISDRDIRGRAVRGIALAVTTTHPRTAERLARLVNGPGQGGTGFAQASFLAEVAIGLAPSDLYGALRVAAMIDPAKDWLLTKVIRALVTANAPAAEGFASALRTPKQRAGALTVVAGHVAGHDPADAERIIVAIDSSARSQARDAVALAVLAGDASTAARLASSADFDRHSTRVQLKVCQALASVAPDLAERNARGMPGSFDRAEALLRVAAVVAGNDPVRSAGLLDDAVRHALACAHDSDHLSNAEDLARFAASVAAYDRQRAAALFEEARELARTRRNPAPYGRFGATAVLRVAEHLAPFDPDAAEKMVRRTRKKIDIQDDWQFKRVVVAAAKGDPSVAIRMARLTNNPYRRDEMLAEAAGAAATVNLAGAVHIVRHMDSRNAPKAWERITEQLLAVNPGAAVRFVLDLAERLTLAEPDGRIRYTTVPVELVRQVARIDPAAAQRVVAAVGRAGKDVAWAAIAEAWAGVGGEDTSAGL
ncbi:protein kinase domain-containing protein [Streptomyces sp. NPDC004126]|uniref:serine/threonine-protein kinase n=1 Tax=Streptomyces sp. NPDC004126 TaxID=3390695 RepID=UPI003D06A477